MIFSFKVNNGNATTSSLETYIEKSLPMSNADSTTEDDLPSMEASLCSDSEHTESSGSERTVTSHQFESENNNGEQQHRLTYDDIIEEDLRYTVSKLKTLSTSKNIMLESHDSMLSQYSSIYPDAATIYAPTRTYKLDKKKAKQQLQTKEIDINPLFSSYNSDSEERKQRRRIGNIQKAFPLPTKCEFCGCSSTKNCSRSDCKRPTSFFQRQRPAFEARGTPKWNLQTDYENPRVEVELEKPVLREWDHTRRSTLEIQKEQEERESKSWITSWFS